MKKRFVLIRLIAVLAITFILFSSTTLTFDHVSAQGGCPSSGTYGKNVSRDFFVQVVGLLKDVPQSDFAVDALEAWKPYEGTNAYWNPLATTWKTSPVCDFNSVGVQNYMNQDTGVRATANTLNLGYYNSIRSMLRLEAFDRESMRSSLGTWGTCSGAGCDGLLDKWQELYQRYSGGVVSTSTSQPPVVSTSTSNVLVIDTSGSMNDVLPAGGVKLDAAKDAGRKLLDIIGAENEAGVSAKHEVAIVDFSDTAVVDMGFTANIDSAQNALSNLYTTGGTGMPKGLKAALDLFPATLTGKSFIILLSDGQPNVGLNDETDESVVRQQVLDLAKEAGQRGICVYTVGFGDPTATGSIDENFLRQVADASGCGTYHNAQNAWELANIYINLRHESTGNTLLKKTGDIKQGENLEIGNAQVPVNQSMILFTLNWPGSQLDAVLTDPSGKLVDKNYPGASVLTKNNLVSIIVQNPLAGSWNVAAYGAQVPEQVINYNAVLSVRPNPNPPTPVPATPAPAVVQPSGGSPFAIVIIILAGVGMIVYVMVQPGLRLRRRTHPLSGSPAVLLGLNGTYAGHSIPLRDGLLIGRSFACALRLSDPSVSRRHARLRYAGGHWYIQDMSGQSGTYVNGARVKAAALNNGDRIRVGSTDFAFRE